MSFKKNVSAAIELCLTTLPAFANPVPAQELLPTSLPRILTTKAVPGVVDVVHASDAVLAGYGLPPRPDFSRNREGYDAWKRAMFALRRQAPGDLREGRVRLARRPAVGVAGQGATAPVHGQLYSNNWSGIVDLNGSTAYNQTTSFQGITATFNVPLAAATRQGDGVEAVAVWAGLDGQTNGDVLQAGIESDVQWGQPTPTTYAWVEWAPYPEAIIPVGVSPGDAVTVTVWNVSATTGYAFLENLSTGVYRTYILTPPPGSSLVGNSAEWITEAPAFSGPNGPYIAPLAFYGSVLFSNAYATDWSNHNFFPGSNGSNFETLVGSFGAPLSVAQLTGLKSLLTVQVNVTSN